MNARDTILQSIVANKPSLVPLPEVDITQVIQFDDVFNHFKSVLAGIGGNVIELENLQVLQDQISAEKRSGMFVVNTISALDGADTAIHSLKARELEAVDKAYIQGGVAVAENGAVWVEEVQMGNRLLPFICQHLVLLVSRENIVATMHHALERIDIAKAGYGAFIAGPSKTADIEQSLVIGAHGARSLLVYIM